MRERNCSVVVRAHRAGSCILRAPLMVEGVGPPYRAKYRASFSVLWCRKESVENEKLLSERVAISNHHSGAQTGLSW